MKVWKQDERSGVYGHLAVCGCVTSLLLVTGALASDCYKVISVSCCLPGSGESGCEAETPEGTVYWNCPGGASGAPAFVDAVTDAGSGESGETAWGQEQPQTCTQTDRSCSNKPNRCVDSSSTFSCIQSYLDGLSCEGGVS
jgi:hypothetical protein